jgi:hypothetical protein
MNSSGQMRRLTGLMLAVVAMLNWMALIVAATPARTGARVEAGKARLTKMDAASRARAAAAFGHLPLGFVANQGQTDARVQFTAESDGLSLFLTPAKAVINLNAPANADTKAARSAALSINVVGANTDAPLTGIEQLPGRSNYLVGNDPARWQRDVPSFAKIEQKNVYRGIDLVYYGNGRQLEYDFVVAAGANPEMIRLDFEGAQQMRVDDEGDLVLKTTAGELRHHSPVAYQVVNGARRKIAARIEIKGRHRVGFRVGRYDRSRALVIDPVLSYSSYYGSGESYVRGMALDSAGNIYLTGSAKTSAFQPTPGAIQGTEAQTAVFVTKLNAAGTAVIYSSIISGKAANSFGYDIAVDADGNAYVTGHTLAADYPVTAGAFQVTGHGDGNQEGFVSKLNPTGTALLYSTYLGGLSDDMGSAIAVDASGNAYVTGYAMSRDFRVAGKALQPTISPSMNTFVAKLNPAGTALDFSSLIGGSGTDTPSRIALDRSGNVVIAGTTDSTDFPTISPLQSSFPTGAAARGSFVARIDPTANPKSPKIMNATVQGKKLMVYGEEFSNGATILIDGNEQSTANDADNQSSMLISKKAGKKIAAGQHVMISVRNADGTLSDEYSFTRTMQ